MTQPVQAEADREVWVSTNYIVGPGFNSLDHRFIMTQPVQAEADREVWVSTNIDIVDIMGCFMISVRDQSHLR